MAAERCHLLELPSELRQVIYDYALPKPDCINVHSLDSGYTEGVRNSPVPPTFLSSGLAMTGVTLLRTRRKIYEEAMPNLYSPLDLELSPALSKEDSRGGVHFPVDQLAGLKIVNKLTLTLFTCAETIEEDLSHSRVLADCLHHRITAAMGLEVIIVVQTEEYEDPEKLLDGILRSLEAFLARLNFGRCRVHCEHYDCDTGANYLIKTELNRSATAQKWEEDNSEGNYAWGMHEFVMPPR